MKEIEINKENLNTFINDIRKTDKEELIYSYKENYKNEFINACIRQKRHIYFVSDKYENPVAIGGIKTVKKGYGLIWLLCTNKLKENKKDLYKYVKNKVSLFKKEYSIIFNYIYKSNFASLNFLKSLGFKIIDLPDENFKMFYFIKGGNNFDL